MSCWEKSFQLDGGMLLQWHCFTHLCNNILQTPPFSVLSWLSSCHLLFHIYFVYTCWSLPISFNKLPFMILSTFCEHHLTQIKGKPSVGCGWFLVCLGKRRRFLDGFSPWVFLERPTSGGGTWWGLGWSCPSGSETRRRRNIPAVLSPLPEEKCGVRTPSVHAWLRSGKFTKFHFFKLGSKTKSEGGDVVAVCNYITRINVKKGQIAIWPVLAEK